MDTPTHQMQQPDPAEAQLREAVELDAEIKQKQARLKELKEAIAGVATFKQGSATGRLTAGGYSAKVTRKENVSWDQGKLNEARAQLGDETFFGLFTWQFKPTAKKDLDAFLAHGSADQVALVQSAMTVKPGAPSITFERVEA